jgi:hypothetical protein
MRWIRSISVTFPSAGRRIPAGGLKWMPLGAGTRSRVGRRRHAEGGLPYARLKARVNASCEE